MIFLTYQDPGSQKTFTSVKNLLEENQQRTHLIYAGEVPTEGNDCYFYNDFGTSKRHQTELITNAEAKELYCSDQDFLKRVRSEEYLLNKTIFTLNKLAEIFEKESPLYIFNVGGGSLFGNCITFMADFKRIQCFRIPVLNYLNVDAKQPRFVFYDNNNYRLKTNQPQHVSEEEIEYFKSKAIAYYDHVKNKSINPDREARKHSSTGFMTPTNIFSAINDLALFFAKYIHCKFRNRQKSFFYEHGARFKRYTRKRIVDLLNLFNLKQYRPSKTKKYFILVLHLPLDSQLAYRGRFFKDQIALARLIACNLPKDTLLYIKEHPVCPGMVGIRDLLSLSQLDNVRYLNYQYIFKDLVAGSSGVLTINSTAGIEAAINDRPVIVFGDAFYTGHPATHFISYLKDLRVLLNELIKVKNDFSYKNEVIDLLTKVFMQSSPSRIEDENLTADKIIAKGILKRIQT